MTLSRYRFIRQGIGKLTRELRGANAECDRIVRRGARFDPKSGDLAAFVRDGLRACAIARTIRGLEYRLAVARELLTYDVERRFQFRRRLHVLENGGRKQYHFWKI